MLLRPEAHGCRLDQGGRSTGHAAGPVGPGRRASTGLTIHLSPAIPIIMSTNLVPGALDTGEPTVIDDVEDESYWPVHLARGKTVALRCSISPPLTIEHTTVGAMNFHNFDQPRIFTGPVRTRCELFAAQASGTLPLSRTRAADHDTLDQLDRALASRTTIDRAIGALNGQPRCTTTKRSLGCGCGPTAARPSSATLPPTSSPTSPHPGHLAADSSL
jgi:hypothetical protein